MAGSATSSVGVGRHVRQRLFNASRSQRLHDKLAHPSERQASKRVRVHVCFCPGVCAPARASMRLRACVRARACMHARVHASSHLRRRGGPAETQSFRCTCLHTCPRAFPYTCPRTRLQTCLCTGGCSDGGLDLFGGRQALFWFSASNNDNVAMTKLKLTKM